jgi:hypothetical protein
VQITTPAQPAKEKQLTRAEESPAPVQAAENKQPAEPTGSEPHRRHQQKAGQTEGGTAPGTATRD